MVMRLHLKDCLSDDLSSKINGQRAQVLAKIPKFASMSGEELVQHISASLPLLRKRCARLQNACTDA